MPVLADHHVRGLDVAVDNALRVSIVKRSGDRLQNANDLVSSYASSISIYMFYMFYTAKTTTLRRAR